MNKAPPPQPQEPEETAGRLPELARIVARSIRAGVEDNNVETQPDGELIAWERPVKPSAFDVLIITTTNSIHFYLPTERACYTIKRREELIQIIRGIVQEHPELLP